VENLERRLIPPDAKLPLELNRAKAGRQRRREIGSPEPHAQRRVRALHDSSRRQRIVLATLAAAQDMRSRGEPERLPALAAPHAYEAVLPADRLHVGRASRVGWEQPLELRQAARKRQVFALKDIRWHGLHQIEGVDRPTNATAQFLDFFGARPRCGLSPFASGGRPSANAFEAAPHLLDLVAARAVGWLTMCQLSPPASFAHISTTSRQPSSARKSPAGI